MALYQLPAQIASQSVAMAPSLPIPAKAHIRRAVSLSNHSEWRALAFRARRMKSSPVTSGCGSPFGFRR